jgi:3-hydroxyisobutyrate dehydrogenase-like beta-hydroxyacid dehydrogenase
MSDDPIGLIGLGLVGKALARRLIAAGYRIVGRDPDRQAGAAARAPGVEVVDELRPSPRAAMWSS